MKKLSIVLAITVTLIFMITGPVAAKTVFLSIGTGGTGGIYYPYGGGVAEIWTRHVPGVRAVAEVTGASVENVKLASKGETVVGEVMGDVAVAGYNGLSKFKGKKQKILSMAIMYPNLLQLVTLKKSPVTNVEQIKGKTISSGSPGSGTNFMAEVVFKALGIPLDSYKDARLSFTESANALRDGTIELGTWSVGPGTSSIMDLATTHDIRIIPFTKEQTKKVLAANKTYSAVELAAGVYKGVDKPVPTIGVWNVMICQDSLDTDLVYRLVKALYEHNDMLCKIHPSAAYTTPENAVKHSPIPLHPGTIKYLKEKGIEVPARLIP
ncbi:MAG: TAXI family TRAP transporter solute-binding subunit [Deltaproteobacteria bacterium]|nr:TAXI family TRAP transporter solute-binding subunit [Deltaproteobacteria bacterium]MBW2048339.1 TAXI family TRAP transporter solute-binding subunit [Deltaproteobacteria bacterium]MBW2352788.1 TAXI family TRAP transporter solute-binding subunit [Deltaproteobacteria bacterium]HDZ89147.1 TAXI family TRAP transporter solute-binding subunit [Deltaproteobacteria bacterium]